MNNQLISIDDDSLDLVSGGADALSGSITLDPLGDGAKVVGALGQAIVDGSQWVYDNTFGVIITIGVGTTNR